MVDLRSSVFISVSAVCFSLSCTSTLRECRNLELGDILKEVGVTFVRFTVVSQISESPALLAIPVPFY